VFGIVRLRGRGVSAPDGRAAHGQRCVSIPDLLPDCDLHIFGTKRVKLASSYLMNDLSLHAPMPMMANSEGGSGRAKFLRADELVPYSQSNGGGRMGG
jgi:hypothetical protein